MRILHQRELFHRLWSPAVVDLHRGMVLLRHLKKIHFIEQNNFVPSCLPVQLF